MDLELSEGHRWTTEIAVSLWLFIFFISGIFPFLIHLANLTTAMIEGVGDSTATILVITLLLVLRERKSHRNGRQNSESNEHIRG